jgi:hydrogenase 3 maturation protease
MYNPFTDVLKGKAVFMGVGNTLRGDDGLGPVMVERLRERGEFICINAGDVPENHIGSVVRENPDTLVIIDAAQLYAEPGAYRMMTREEILEVGFSTHTVSPAVLMGHLGEVIEAGIFLLGIQPKSIQVGEELSEEVKRTIDELIGMIERASP